MDKQLHIRILDVLQQNNAIGHLVDIKPAFLDELDTQEKRKNFKAHIDHLVKENLIETGGKFEFLGWELLTGLYPIDKKKIEAGLIGNWQSYLASKRGTFKSEPVILPKPEAAKPAAKTGLYEAPETVLPYPGTNAAIAADKPDATPAKEIDVPEFKARIQPPKPLRAPNANDDRFLREDDFLPFKSRVQKKQEPTPEEPLTPTAPANTYLPPLAENTPKPVADDMPPPEFSELKTTYTPPKGEVKDIAVTVKPFTPTDRPLPVTQPVAEPAPEAQPAPLLPPVGTKPPPSVRIAAHRVRRDNDKDGDDDAPIITARTAGLRAKKQQPPPPAAEEAPAPIIREPVIEAQPAARVVNLSASAAAQGKRAEPVMAPVRNTLPAQAPQPVVADSPPPVASSNPNPVLPPPTKNFAAIRFDTDNNPFASLGRIDLTADAPPKKSLWDKVKWYVIGFVLLALVIAYNAYKKRYS